MAISSSTLKKIGAESAPVPRERAVKQRRDCEIYRGVRPSQARDSAL